jgi:O-antigen ligase
MITLYVFTLLRPITVAFPTVKSISILDIFGIGASFLMLIGLLLNLRTIKISGLSVLIIFFIFYCLLSLFWHSEYREVSRTILPFIPFFLVNAVVEDIKDIQNLIFSLILGYFLPILGSVFLIATGQSETMITGSFVERESGLSSGPHTLGHLMLFFSFTYGIYYLLNAQITHPRNLKSLAWHSYLFFLLLGSLLCIYKSYTRTVFVGSILFWFVYIWSWKKKWFLILSILIALLTMTFYSSMETTFWQKKWGERYVSHDLNTASSGRLTIWHHNLKLFSGLSPTTKILGVGLGNELKALPDSYEKWIGSHNDYLSLLLVLGVLGLTLYLSMYLLISIKIIRAPIPQKMRGYFLIVIASVIIMNFLSNSYIVRFQMAQLFWFLIGMLYALSTLYSQEANKKDSQEFQVVLPG